MALSKQQITAQLKGIYPFRTLPLSELEFLVGKLEQKTLQKDELIYDIGKEAHQFLIISSGVIHLERLNSNNQYETFSNLDPGEFAGLEAIYPENPYDTRAICQTSGTILILKQTDLTLSFNLASGQVDLTSTNVSLPRFTRMIEDVTIASVQIQGQDDANEGFCEVKFRRNGLCQPFKVKIIDRRGNYVVVKVDALACVKTTEYGNE